ncbi:unnamed protein product [Pararhodospirillum photometricum DSM 122]|uniref:Uncharacterized protein n=2 Tax=Pararhodospirillum photometricum TaxID=1084 RepID=H6SJW6_PARPM|nr:unnamed protein product [Pararhodospirillum photometricum DSM 122]
MAAPTSRSWPLSSGWPTPTRPLAGPWASTASRPLDAAFSFTRTIMDLNDFAVDEGLFEGGFVLMLSADSGVRLRSAGSDKAQAVRERLYKPYSSFREIPDDIQARLTCDWIAQGLAVEWIGPWTIGGVPLDTSDPKVVSQALQHPKFKPLRTKLLLAASSEDNFRAAAEAGAEKN